MRRSFPTITNNRSLDIEITEYFHFQLLELFLALVILFLCIFELKPQRLYFPILLDNPLLHLLHVTIEELDVLG